MIQLSSISKNLEEGKIKLIDVLDIYHALSTVEQGRINLLIKTLVDGNEPYYYFGTPRPAQMVAKYFNVDQIVHLEDEPDTIHNVIMYRLSDLVGVLNSNDKSEALMKVPSILYSPCYTIDQLRGKIRSLLLLYKLTEKNSILLEDVIPFCINDFEKILKMSLLTTHDYCIGDVWNRIISLCDQPYNSTLAYYIEVFCSLLNFNGLDKDILLDVIELYSEEKIEDRELEPVNEINEDEEYPKDLLEEDEIDEGDAIEVFSFSEIRDIISSIFKKLKNEVDVRCQLDESELCELRINYGDDLSCKLVHSIFGSRFADILTIDGEPYLLFKIIGDKSHIYGVYRDPENDENAKVFQYKKGDKEYKFIDYK